MKREPDFIVIPLRGQEQFRCPGCGQYRPTEYFGDVTCQFCGSVIRCDKI